MDSNRWEVRYFNGKEKILQDKDICQENRDLFAKFFKYQEYKLKRINDLRELDNKTYNTLYCYIQMFRNVNLWFHNKPFINITEKDIQQVYDGLEDGEIKRKNGKPFEGLNHTYYSKVFKSTLFELAGKKDLAKQIMKYTKRDNKEVRFITEEDFRKIINVAYKPHHRCLLWLAFDIGENVNALLNLKRSDFYKQKNPHTKEPEYRINLRRDILKRTRKPRSEITNYAETVEFIDQLLKGLKPDELLFKIDYGGAKKIIDRLVERAGVKCIPKGEKTTWKDLRSGMACDLLKKGWTTDEVNSRLGHRPSSDEIDKYVNFLALDRHRPKKKVQEFEMQQLREEMEGMKKREKLHSMRLEELKDMFIEKAKREIKKKK